MGRASKPEEFTTKRNEILDVAMQLVYTKGYEQMSIQDILNDLHISKGAFYHYFDSKGALLEGLIVRMIDQAEQVLKPVLDDPRLDALQKLQLYLSNAAQWKSGRMDYIKALIQVWYNDDNAIVRQKILTATIQRIAPFIAKIIHQGIQEGVFHVTYPDQVSQVLMVLIQSMADTLIRCVFLNEPNQVDWNQIRPMVNAYDETLERAIGAPPGSIHLVDMEILKSWFAPNP
jgi:AcrR family transcriptional regulator